MKKHPIFNVINIMLVSSGKQYDETTIRTTFFSSLLERKGRISQVSDTPLFRLFLMMKTIS